MTSKERKIWEKEQKRNRIIDIAQEIFFSKGFDTATMDEIAKSAGYNKRTMYLYFKDKEDLFLAVVLRGQKILVTKLEEAFHSPATQGTIIYNLGNAFFRFSLEYPDFFNLIMIYEARSRDYFKKDEVPDSDSFKDQCHEASDRYGRFVIEAIEIGKKSGLIKSELTAQQLMLILWGEVFGVMQIILIRKDHFNEAYGITPEELFNNFMRFTEKALS
ncbi:MAG: hypothetical protein CVV44_18825 [Spirochaetae bacterium HGW-Spirochaetae-1]|jgi:AcrR family transcriptional regulator|nr:MAG: hypothetical protein CVV44_18825 [Spirochaetae bacterium HGW-Spirochaetae-1]